MSARAVIDGSRGQKVAIGLALPGGLISSAACFLIPWMIETERRLQNQYWEGQLVFAISALAIASAGFPFLLLRVFCRRRAVAICCWAVPIMGYLAVFSYIVQSHFPILSKLIVGLVSVAFTVSSIKGLQEDWADGHQARS
jgi:hypothetical protein